MSAVQLADQRWWLVIHVDQSRMERSYCLFPADATETTKNIEHARDATAYACIKLHADKTLELSWCQVKEASRGQQIGTKFLAHVLRDVDSEWSHGCTGVGLCDVSFPKTGVYTRLGFSPARGSTFRYFTFPRFDSIAQRSKERRRYQAAVDQEELRGAWFGHFGATTARQRWHQHKYQELARVIVQDASATPPVFAISS